MLPSWGGAAFATALCVQGATRSLAMWQAQEYAGRVRRGEHWGEPVAFWDGVPIRPDDDLVVRLNATGDDLVNSTGNSTLASGIFRHAVAGTPNSTFSRGIYRQAESDREELQLNAPPLPERNKVAIAFIFALHLGLCGLDRCFFDQVVLGVIKGLTCGGLGVWFIIDAVVLGVNCLAKWDSIDTLGFEAAFQAGQVETAFWIALAGILVNCALSCCGAHAIWMRQPLGEDDAKDVDYR
jgi:hypothetical protein